MRSSLTLAATFLLASTALGQQASDVRALVTRAVQAHGGEELLTKYAAGSSRGKGRLFAQTGPIPFTFESHFLLPDKVKDVIEFEIMGRKVRNVAVVNGATAVVEENGVETKLSDMARQSLKEIPHVVKVSRLVPLLKDKELELTPLPESKVGDRVVLGVKVSAKGHKDISLFFDRETGLLTRLEHRGADPAGREYLEERLVGDYERVEGIPSPKKMTVSRNGQKFLEFETLEIKFFEKLDDKVFAR